MDKKLKNKWVKALESGKYLQGEGALKNNDDKYCCLGVLCEVAGKKFTKYNGNRQKLVGYKTVTTQILPESFKKKYGISKQLEDECIRLNDSEQLSFKQIAKWLRKNA